MQKCTFANRRLRQKKFYQAIIIRKCFIIRGNLFLTKLYSVWAFSGLVTDEGAPKEATLHKICHTYPTMMKLGTVIPYLKKMQEIYESRDAPLEFC